MLLPKGWQVWGSQRGSLGLVFHLPFQTHIASPSPKPKVALEGSRGGEWDQGLHTPTPLLLTGPPRLAAPLD